MSSKLVLKSLRSAVRTTVRPTFRGCVLATTRIAAPKAAVCHFSTSVTRCNQVTDDLAKVLNSELEFEKKDSFGLDESYTNYLQLSGFQIVNSDKKVLAELIKKDGPETIHVYFDVLRITQASYELRQFQEEMQNQDDIASTPEFEDLAFSDVNVVVEKNGKAVGFDLSLSLLNNDFAVTAITNFDNAELALSDSPEAAAARDLTYSGPSFSNLADELQESLEQFLVSRGIDNQLGEFVLAYASVKENSEYVSWLDNLKTFFQ
ncbi:DEKNAAC101907 [Brettanomyces naardenensis]|uniref:DEKNAAC101907 n=1 Tax=Brettanomyces naardenensis TaxID=13370 RepID=A0A448YIZ3_BRENA|nr:DEKNAAC101907 [Brettanomyces naardenensis]